MLAADALVVQPCSELESPGVSGGSLQLLFSVSCFSNEGADPASSNLLTVSFELLCQTRTCFSLLETTAVHQKSCEPAGELTETPMLVSGLLPYADLTRTS